MTDQATPRTVDPAISATMTDQYKVGQDNFARQVRTERLSILWKVTLAILAALLWLMLIVSTASPGSPAQISLMIPIVVGALGCGGAAYMLKRGRYETAVWAYIGGLLIAGGIVLVHPPGESLSASGRDIILGAFPLLILLTGLMLPTRATMIAMALTVGVILFAPQIGQGRFTVEKSQLAAVVFTVLGTGIAAQMAGELYGIADWALESYRKERKFKEQLFDTQQEVNRSLMRQKSLTSELQASNIELETARAAAYEAKTFRGQFLANMSHELRTPLNAIIGFSETMLSYPMMYDNVPLPDAYRNDMGQIYTSGKHLLQLINDILDLSKVDAGKLELEVEEIDLDPVFRGVMATAAGLVGDRPIELVRDTPLPLPTVKGDSLRLRQVILNLLSNGVKFTDRGAITLGARDNGAGEVEFFVRDTGIGIPAEELGTVFEEFKQGSSGRRKGRAGSGLGLAICKQLLSLMGGRIWADSTVGKGSTFYFALPIYAVSPSETSSRPLFPASVRNN